MVLKFSVLKKSSQKCLTNCVFIVVSISSFVYKEFVYIKSERNLNFMVSLQNIKSTLFSSTSEQASPKFFIFASLPEKRRLLSIVVDCCHIDSLGSNFCAVREVLRRRLLFSEIPKGAMIHFL